MVVVGVKDAGKPQEAPKQEAPKATPKKKSGK